MEERALKYINIVYKILIWIVLFTNIILLTFTIRVHKEMEQERKENQAYLEQVVNQLVEKRLKQPIK